MRIPLSRDLKFGNNRQIRTCGLSKPTMAARAGRCSLWTNVAVSPLHGDDHYKQLWEQWFDTWLFVNNPVTWAGLYTWNRSRSIYFKSHLSLYCDPRSADRVPFSINDSARETCYLIKVTCCSRDDTFHQSCVWFKSRVLLDIVLERIVLLQLFALSRDLGNEPIP